MQRQFRKCLTVGLLLSLVGLAAHAAAEPESIDNARRPANETELRAWLENMVAYHRYSPAEVREATGLATAEITAAITRWNIQPGVHSQRKADDPLTVLPYPGGRHPRIGFLDGAVRPQRETKLSVFTPWDEHSYVVADIPEAIWSQRGLIYLAHTHVPTVWDKQSLKLEPLEWKRLATGGYECERTLPEGIRFGVRAIPTASEVRMEMWLVNGSQQPLSDLRVQNCVMLKGAAGFEQQDVENKVFQAPYAACRARDAARWVITAWTPNHRTWGNAPCPCLHSDPKFSDCAPGETQRLKGWLSFYEGDDLPGELRRIDATGWRN